MKTARFVISALLMLTTFGCGTGTPTSTTVMTPTQTYAFAIYLLANDVSPEQLASLSLPELESEPILTIDDIITYDAVTHEIVLTASGYERIHSLHVPTSGKAFAVCVHGEVIYVGAFWVGYSSQSFDGIVIDPILATREHPVIQIQLGYPAPSFFRGEVLRTDLRIIKVLDQAGKLR